jgi:hypothetical protein
MGLPLPNNESSGVGLAIRDLKKTGSVRRRRWWWT